MGIVVVVSYLRLIDRFFGNGFWFLFLRVWSSRRVFSVVWVEFLFGGF